MYEWAELRHFKYLLTILERQGFRAAAEELRTAQPNLSVQARQFQENASVRLFRKMKGGRIRPTETLELHFFEGYSLREIAERKGQTVGNVRHHYYRALECLRSHLFPKKRG